MSGILTTLGSSLPSGAAIGVFLGACLVWLAHRVISVIELRIILRSLPRADRVTAAVAYISAYRSQAAVPAAMPHRRGIASPDRKASQISPVGAENPITLCDLGVFMDQAIEPVATKNLDISRHPKQAARYTTGTAQVHVPPAPVTAEADRD
jgi:hypothetical protein